MLQNILKILQSQNVFLTGGGGVGKSFTTTQIISHYKLNGQKVVALGSTGIAAVGIGGVTLHSFFCLGICQNYDELRVQDRKKSQKERVEKLAKILQKTALIVIDEISMISPNVLDLVYFRLATLGFCGRVMVVGDFFQLPPVFRNESDEKTGIFANSKYAFGALSWREFNFKIIELIGSKRTQNAEFSDVLSNLRIGVLSSKITHYLSSLLALAPHENDSVICGTNAEANLINAKKLSLLSGNLVVCEAIVDILTPNAQVDSWLKNFENMRILELKVGAKVLFTINKRFDEIQIYNGESGIISEIIRENEAVLRIEVIKENGEKVLLERNPYEFSDYADENAKPIATFYQFPLRLSYGLTIHKSQGMSIANLTCDINRIFADGQLYVALSRAMDPQNLRILYKNPARFGWYLSQKLKINREVVDFYHSSNILRF